MKKFELTNLGGLTLALAQWCITEMMPESPKENAFVSFTELSILRYSGEELKLKHEKRLFMTLWDKHLWEVYHGGVKVVNLNARFKELGKVSSGNPKIILELLLEKRGTGVSSPFIPIELAVSVDGYEPINSTFFYFKEVRPEYKDKTQEKRWEKTSSFMTLLRQGIE